jgi:hypothetical protein
MHRRNPSPSCAPGAECSFISNGTFLFPKSITALAGSQNRNRREIRKKAPEYRVATPFNPIRKLEVRLLICKLDFFRLLT